MFFLLLFLWIIFNGKITLEILIFGVIISAAVCAFLCRFLGYSFKRELKLLCILPQIVAYVVVLVTEILKANMAVLGFIFKGRDSIKPAFCHFRTPLKSRLARTVLANSITLTPGTITVSLHEDEYYVHCLDSSLADGITDSRFVKRLMKMEEKIYG